MHRATATFNRRNRRLLQTVAGGLTALGVFQLHRRRQNLLQPGPESGDSISPFDTLLLTLSAWEPGLSPSRSKHSVVRWAASAVHVDVQRFFENGLHRIVLSSLNDCLSPHAIDAVAAAETLKVLAMLSRNEYGRRLLLNTLGESHWATLVQLQLRALKSDRWQADFFCLLDDVAAEMLSHPTTEQFPMFEGLKRPSRDVSPQGSAPGSQLSLGLQAAGAVTSFPDSSDGFNRGRLALPILGLVLLGHSAAGLGADALGPVVNAVSLHAGKLSQLLLHSSSSKDQPVLTMRSMESVWLRALSDAATVTANASEAALLHPVTGPQDHTAPATPDLRVDPWLVIGSALLLGSLGRNPLIASPILTGETSLQEQLNNTVACLCSITSIGSLLRRLAAHNLVSLRDTENWATTVAPVLQAYGVSTLAPIALFDCYERRAHTVSRNAAVVEEARLRLYAALVTALSTTLACFTPELRYDIALMRPSAEALESLLHVVDRPEAAISRAPFGTASSVVSALLPARILEQRIDHVEHDEVHSDDITSSGTILGLPGTLAPLPQDLVSMFPSPKAQTILKRTYAPVAPPVARGFAQGALPEFPVLRRSRGNGESRVNEAQDGPVALVVLPSPVDLLCGLTRNLPGTSAATAAINALDGLLAHDVSEKPRVTHSQLLVAQAWLASALSGAVDTEAQGCRVMTAPDSPTRLVPAPVAASATRELLRWVKRHRTPQQHTSGQGKSTLPDAPWQRREGAPVDLLPPFVYSEMLSPGLAARTTVPDAALGAPRRVPLFDELTIPAVHASSALHVHLCKSMAYLTAVPRDSPRPPMSVQAKGARQLEQQMDEQHLAAAIALRLAEQGVLRPLLFVARFYSSGLVEWQRSATAALAATDCSETPRLPRPSLPLQMDAQYREAVAVLRQCLRVGANVAYGLRSPARGDADAPDARAARALRRTWGESAAEWHATCADASALEDLKAHCQAVRILSNCKALAAAASESGSVELPSYGDSVMPLLELPPPEPCHKRQQARGRDGPSPIDMVFVHGLQGAGLKTWRAGSGWCATHVPEDDGRLSPLEDLGGRSAPAEDGKGSTPEDLTRASHPHDPPAPGYPFYCLSTSIHATGQRVPVWPAIWLTPDLRSRGVSPRTLVVVYDADVWSTHVVRPLRSLEELAFELCCQLRDAHVGVTSDPLGTLVPAVFIGHSMGGLVIKHVLREAAALAASSDSNSQLGGPWSAFRLPSATAGVAFIATPHNGSPVASWMCRRLSSVHRWVPGAGTADAGPWAAPLLASMQEGEKGLAQLDADFLSVLRASPPCNPATQASELDPLFCHGSGGVAVLSLMEGAGMPVIGRSGAPDAAVRASSSRGSVPVATITRTPANSDRPVPSAAPLPATHVRASNHLSRLRDSLRLDALQAPSVMVVPAASACPNYGLCASVKGADHVQICKPDSASSDDARYALVRALALDAARSRST